MILILAAVATAVAERPPWWGDFKREYDRCGLVFNVEARPAGDGVFIEKNYSGLLLDSSKSRPQKPIHCIARWAKGHGLKVRYKSLGR